MGLKNKLPFLPVPSAGRGRAPIPDSLLGPTEGSQSCCGVLTVVTVPCPEASIHSASPYLEALTFLPAFPPPCSQSLRGSSGLSTRLSLTYSQHLQWLHIFAFIMVLCQQASLAEAGSSILIDNFVSSPACLPTHLSLTYPWEMDFPSGPFPEVPLPPQAILLKGFNT